MEREIVKELYFAQKYICIAEQLFLSQLTQQQKKTVDEYTKKRQNIQFGEMFSNERTYFDLSSSKLSDIKMPQQISDVIDKQGYYCTDYRNGYVYKKDDKLKSKPVKLIKVLRKGIINEQEFNHLKKQFDQRLKSNRKENIQCLICITHNPYDVAGMSTDRSWTSCMDLKGGAFKTTPLKQVQYGGMCAYLIKKADKNIQQPIARIAIKRLIGQNGGYIFVSQNRIYGDSQFAKQVNFDKQVIRILEQSNKITLDNNSIIYKRKDGDSYSDLDISVKLNFKNDDELVQYVMENKDKLYDLIDGLGEKQINVILHDCLDVLNRNQISYILDRKGNQIEIHLYNRQHFLKLMKIYPLLLQRGYFDDQSLNIIINYYLTQNKDVKNVEQLSLIFNNCNDEQRSRILKYALSFQQPLFALYHFNHITKKQSNYIEQVLKQKDIMLYNVYTFNEKNDQQKYELVKKIIDENNNGCLAYIFEKGIMNLQLRQLILQYIMEKNQSFSTEPKN